MSDIVVGSKNEKRIKQDPIPEGPTLLGCYGICDIGTHDVTFKGVTKSKRKVIFLFEAPEHRIKIVKDGIEKDLPRGLSRELTASMYSEAPFRKMLESWRGRKFTDEEEKAFSLKNVLGKFCLGNISHTAKKDGDGVWENIETVMPVIKGMKIPASCENPLVIWTIGDPTDGIPKWVLKKASESKEWAQIADPVPPAPPAKEQEDDSDSVPF
jgi:hypothetical protein